MTQLTIATSVALLVGGLVWLGLFLRYRNAPASAARLFPAVLAVGLLCRVAFVFLTPVFYAPDEEPHFNYVKYLTERSSFPVQSSKVGDATKDWENNQPPLYYLALVPFYWAAGLFQEPAATVRILRCLSVLLWLLNVWFGAILLRRLRIVEPFTWLFVMAMVCLLPTYVFVSAAINNDNLLATFGGGLLCLLARRELTLKSSSALGLLLGVALLTKQSAVVFIPAIVLLPVLECFSRRLQWRTGLRHLALVLGIALVVYFPWALRNWRVYGTLTPEYLAATPLHWPSLLDGLASAAHNLVKSFWSVSGISNDVGYPFPLLGMLLLVLWFAGQQTDLTREQKTGSLGGKLNGAVMGAMLLAVLVNVVLVLRFGYLFGMGQGRHLFPLLLPIALFLATGLYRLPVKHLPIHAAGFWMTYAISFTVFSVCRFP